MSAQTPYYVLDSDEEREGASDDDVELLDYGINDHAFLRLPSTDSQYQILIHLDQQIAVPGVVKLFLNARKSTPPLARNAALPNLVNMTSYVHQMSNCRDTGWALASLSSRVTLLNSLTTRSKILVLCTVATFYGSSIS